MLFFQDFRSDVNFFGVVLGLARPSEVRCFPPGRWFFRSCFAAAAAGNRSCRKRLFFQDFRSDVRHFFGVVLGLARPSEAWCFQPGRWFFRSCFTAAAAGNRSCRKRLFFQDFRSDVRHFFGVVLELARPSEARCFPPGRWFFRSCFTAAAAGNRSCRKRLFFQDFRSDVRHFFGVVCWNFDSCFRPSEAWCFPPGRCKLVFFEKSWFWRYLVFSSRRQQKLSKKVVFLGR